MRKAAIPSQKKDENTEGRPTSISSLWNKCLFGVKSPITSKTREARIGSGTGESDKRPHLNELRWTADWKLGMSYTETGSLGAFVA